MEEQQQERVGPLWPPAGNTDEQELSADFTDKITQRVGQWVTVRDYLQMFAEGFVSIIVGFLHGVPDRTSDKNPEEKEQP
jgi:hypothetical protein